MEKNAIQLAEDFSAEVMARIIARHAGIDKVMALKIVRYYRQRERLVEPASFSRKSLPANGSPDPDDDRDELISNEKERYKKLLVLQHLLGGEIGDVGDPPEDGVIGMKVNFQYPIDFMLERLAEYKDIPVEQLEHKFEVQLKQAFAELLETGKGHLPDFGIIRLGNGGTQNIEFDISEEVERIFEECEEK